ncbi:MAG: DNA-directed RNA polymerase subunit alpha [Acidimicrobiales bacterium]
MLIIQRPTVEPIGDPDEIRQRFAIGPLDPGFGHTLGATLRRTLLSSIPGAAITQVRFDEALHEFTYLPGVKEDVSDIILNLKDLVLDSHSDEPVTVRVDVRGPADVTGADLKITSDIEILNPALHIASVNGKGRLAMDVTIERGKGYATAERKQATAIGVIPIDSIFSPVRRVAYEIEPTRVEVSTDYDRLVLDIETDGSVSPREALASAGQTLRDLLSLVAELADEGQGLELGEVGTASTGSPDLDLPIEDLDLSERPRNCLKRAQINTVGELIQRTPEDLLTITNFGQKSLDEVLVRLDERGLSLRVGSGSGQLGGATDTGYGDYGTSSPLI